MMQFQIHSLSSFSQGRASIYPYFTDEETKAQRIKVTNYRHTATAAAKSLQSCPTLCDPIDGSPPGSHPWDSPGKNPVSGKVLWVFPCGAICWCAFECRHVSKHAFLCISVSFIHVTYSLWVYICLYSSISILFHEEGEFFFFFTLVSDSLFPLHFSTCLPFPGTVSKRALAGIYSNRLNFIYHS